MDIKVKPEYLSEAVELHKKNPVVDAHLDLAGEILLRYQVGEKNVIQKHYLKHWRSAGINLIFSSIYVENRMLMESWANALSQIEVLKEDIKDLAEVLIIYDHESLEKALTEQKIGIVIYMEGLDCIGEDIDRLDELYRLGVRGASLTWSRKNVLATGCCTATKYEAIPGGLTKTGVRAVKRLEKLSMFLDISHLNDDGFDDICSITNGSFLATHSGSKTIYDNFRNLTDKQIFSLAECGGIMGMNGCKYIAGSQSGNHLEMLCRHIEYETSLVGAEHVGYGFDLCDSYSLAKAALLGQEYSDREDCLCHQGQIPLVSAALLQRGMTKEEVVRIMGSNFLDYLRRYLP